MVLIKFLIYPRSPSPKSVIWGLEILIIMHTSSIIQLSVLWRKALEAISGRRQSDVCFVIGSVGRVFIESRITLLCINTQVSIIVLSVRCALFA